MTSRRGNGAFALYLVLAVVGAALPLWVFVPWIAAHGFDVQRLVADLFANRVGAFFGLDVIVSAVVLLVCIGRERVPHRWLAVVATLGIGVSCGMPLFFALRERAMREVSWR